MRRARRSTAFGTVGLLSGLIMVSLSAASAGTVPSGASTPVPGPSHPGAAASSDSLHAAWQAGGCPLCHDVPDVAPASRQDSCTDCHTWIRKVSASPAAREKAMQVFPLWTRYEKNVASYLQVPSLQAAMARLDPAWVDGYLQDPHDLRPGLPEGMPRFALSDAQRKAIVDGFAAATASVPATPAPDPARLAAGEALFTAKACAGCHSLGWRHKETVLPMAPDLAHTRARMDKDHVAAWIRDPKSLSDQATMPTLPLTDEEVLALRDYVLLADIDGTPTSAMRSGLPAPTTEPVAWADVEREVFGKICVHCHMDPAQNEGRAGPGNAGGFGWAATGIELQTYEGVVSVADRIPDALARRRHEAARDDVAPGELPAALTRPERPGMPLGLPPLSDEQTALVLGWIDQGMPRE
ncbi:MAG: c-type cytochrome [Alphaproteobacteria bacterium]|nr:c-type cytochrome [Alphaproteobacteria bacterium]